jgi:hypothetical protein
MLTDVPQILNIKVVDNLKQKKIFCKFNRVDCQFIFLIKVNKNTRKSNYLFRESMVLNLESNFSITTKFINVYCNYKQQLSQNKW